jgi:putative MATE family efflux protein
MSKHYDPLTGKVLPTFLSYAIPSIFGMLSITTATIVDGIFLGNYVGSEALAAVNLAIPVMTLLYALVFTMAVGGSVTFGKFLGENNIEAASDVFTKTMFVMLVGSLIITTVSLIFLDFLVSLLGANDALRPMVMDYLELIFLFGPALLVGYTLFYFVRADGHPLLANGALLASAAVNIGLDWLFIVKLGKGIEGAALATGIAEAVVLLALIPTLLNKSNNLHLRWVKGGWDKITQAAANGVSEFANELSIGIMTLVFNWVMITRLGVDGVAAFAVISYIVYLGVMICYGISESLQPTISKNFGAKQPARIRAFLSVALFASFIVGVIFAALLAIFPDFLIGLFLNDDELATTKIALTFMAVFWPAVIFNGMNISLTSYFTAMHRPVESAIIAFARSLIVPAICLLTLPHFLGDMGIYISIPIAEALTFILCLVLLARNSPSRLAGGASAKSGP